MLLQQLHVALCLLGCCLCTWQQVVGLAWCWCEAEAGRVDIYHIALWSGRGDLWLLLLLVLHGCGPVHTWEATISLVEVVVEFSLLEGSFQADVDGCHLHAAIKGLIFSIHGLIASAKGLKSGCSGWFGALALLATRRVLHPAFGKRQSACIVS
jgi:hypothetical protein